MQLNLSKKQFLLVLLLILQIFDLGCGFSANRKRARLQKILEKGNAEFNAKRYDHAIYYYDQGLQIVQNEPVFLDNKSTALRMRGIELYNSSIKLEDKQTKTANIEIAKNDIISSAELSTMSVEQLKKTSQIELLITDSLTELLRNRLAGHYESMRLLTLIVDKSNADKAIKALREYHEVETDQEKRLKSHLSAAKMLTDTLNGEKAIIEYKKILSEKSSNLEALAGIGMALAQSGQPDDFKEAKRYLQKFIEQAPADHPSIPTAKEIINSK